MKALIILLLLLPTLALGAGAKKGGPAGGDTPTAYLIDENFDATTSGVPDSSWTVEAGTSYDFDKTPGLNSTPQKLFIDGETQGSGVEIIADLGAEYTELWVKLIMKNVSTAEASVAIVNFENGAGIVMGRVMWRLSGGMRVYYSTGELDTGTADLVLDTEYCLWVHWKVQSASGNDGVIQTYLDTSVPYVRPDTADAEKLDGNTLTAGDGINTVHFVGSATMSIEIDEVLIHDETIN